MTLQEEILSLLEDDSKSVDAQWIVEVCKKYPYFSLPAILMLKRNEDIDEELKQTLNH